MFSALGSPSPTVLHLSVFSCPLLLTPPPRGHRMVCSHPKHFQSQRDTEKGVLKVQGCGVGADEKANRQGQKDWDTQALATTQAQRFPPRLPCLNHTL